MILNSNPAIDLISDAIFGSGHAHGLTSIQELQRVVVLCEYFNAPCPDENRNAVFLSIFGPNMSKDRIRLLGKLISTSISAVIAPLLCAAGTWNQQLGCTSQSSLELAEYLIEVCTTEFVQHISYDIILRTIPGLCHLLQESLRPARVPAHDCPSVCCQLHDLRV